MSTPVRPTEKYIREHSPSAEDIIFTRRQFLLRSGMGFGGMSLAAVFGINPWAEGASALAPGGPKVLNPLAPKQPHFPAKAKHIIHIFASGGPTQVDTWDPKPELTKFDGKSIPGHDGLAFGSPFKFTKQGQSGVEVNMEVFPKLGAHIDDIAVIRSLWTDIPAHEVAQRFMNTGSLQLPKPSFGSWVVYGLGTDNQNMPGFVVMCPGGYPIQESQNWQSGFLPGVYQGTYIDTKHTQIEKLIENINNARTSPESQKGQLALLRKLNEEHRRARTTDPQLDARIQSFELAYRMQMDAADAFDIQREPESVRKLYGEGTQSRQLLIARRLVERGVRFVQVWHGAGQPWDNHDDLEVNHRKLARESDQGIAGLLTDLKQRGMLEDTLVIWGGEFGRTPTVELPTPGANSGKINGRDHNNHGFTMWLAGGGVKGGTVYGATDEFGFAAAENPVHVHDLHATLLALLGFDHEKFTYHHAGRDFRLTDLHGKVVRGIMA